MAYSETPKSEAERQGKIGEKRHWAAGNELRKIRLGDWHEKGSCTESKSGELVCKPVAAMNSTHILTHGRTLKSHQTHSSVPPLTL